MTKFFRTIGWKTSTDKWDRKEIETDLFVILAALGVAYLAIWSFS